MGYDAYILILGNDVNNKLCELSYWTIHGAYSGKHNHYLPNRVENNYNYIGSKEMGEYQYIVSFEEIEEDYNIHKSSLKNVKYDIMNIIDKEEDNFKIIHKLDEYIYEMLKDKHNEHYYEELEYIYEVCKKFVNDRYKSVKVIYGISP
jgi:hypothetical protein